MEHTWEYKVLKFRAKGWFVGGNVDADELQAALNQFGKEGWELVTIFDANTETGKTKDIVATLKRKII
jgi:hypothetical protein